MPLFLIASRFGSGFFGRAVGEQIVFSSLITMQLIILSIILALYSIRCRLIPSIFIFVRRSGYESGIPRPPCSSGVGSKGVEDGIRD